MSESGIALDPSQTSFFCVARAATISLIVELCLHDGKRLLSALQDMVFSQSSLGTL